jgi:probable selenium-dependent hydroxylase accessory protein YqeC
VTALAGGGGKTGLAEALENELRRDGRPCLVTVTTRLGAGQLGHLGRVQAASLEEAAGAVERARGGERILLTGPDGPDGLKSGKIPGIPADWIDALRKESGPELVWLAEADGSAGRPIKAHRPDEPVLPSGPLFLIMVLGLSALSAPWGEAVHRPEIFARHVRLPSENRPLLPEEIASFAAGAWAGLSPDLLFLNQWDCLDRNGEKLALCLADGLTGRGFKVVYGSLFQNSFAARPA